jgi:hypothetical protein
VHSAISLASGRLPSARVVRSSGCILASHWRTTGCQEPHLDGAFGIHHLATAEPCAHDAGKLLDLREVIVSLVEMWRDSGRLGDNTLLPEALPSLLLAVDAAGQRELLDTVRTLLNKVQHCVHVTYVHVTKVHRL